MNQADFQASNPYASFGSVVADAPATERMAFIKRTYMHLMLAVYAVVALEWIFFQFVPDELVAGLFNARWGWLIMLGAFALVGHVANKWAMSSTSLSTQYWGLGLYVLAESIILYPLLWIASQFGGTVSVGGMQVGPIAVAGVITGLVFAALTAIVFTTKKDFSFLGPALGIGIIVAMGLILVSIIGGFNLGIWFSGAMILVAAGYILYETSNIMHHYRTTQHVAASLALFASVALLFWYVLQIVLSLMNRD